MSNDKIAVVTGARRGIGFGVAKALGLAGYTVLISAVSEPKEAKGALDELKSLGINCCYCQCDISKSEDRNKLVQFSAERLGRVDVLVNNAGVAPPERQDILNATEESFEKVLDVNLKGTFFMSQSFANLMISEKKKNLWDYSPRIINISSISAYTSSTLRGEYCVSKAGIAMVTTLFADRLAEYGIPVFEIRPGIILTDMTAPVKAKYETMIAEGITPIKRFGRPQDVADCVMAACSGLLDFSAGQVLNADGGFHLRRL